MIKITKQQLKTLVLGGRTDFSEYDYSHLEDLSGLFSDELALVSFPELHLDNVKNMDSMFEGCVNLSSVSPISMASCESAKGMFKGCSSLEVIPVFNTLNVVFMDSMFENCDSLRSLPYFIFSIKAKSCAKMFASCECLDGSFMDASGEFYERLDKQRIEDRLEGEL